MENVENHYDNETALAEYKIWAMSTIELSVLRSNARFQSTIFQPVPYKYESADYTKVNNNISIHHDEQFRESAKPYLLLRFCHWMMIALIAFTVSIFVFLLIFIVTLLCILKCKILEIITEDFPNSLWSTYSSWILMNIIFMTIASGVCIVFARQAAGGNVAAVIAFLNGTRIERILSRKVILIKFISTIAQQCTAVLGGREGPIIHASVAIGYKLPEFTARIRYFPILNRLYATAERRDFAVCGVAAGVAAAFGAPLAGAILALEEATSFFNVDLFVRIIACSFLSNMFLMLYTQIFALEPMEHPEKIYYKLFPIFGKSSNIITPYTFAKIAICIFMGTAGALSGSAYTLLSKRMMYWKHTAITNDYARFAETILNASIVAIFHITMLYAFSDDCLKHKDFSTDDNNTHHEFHIPPVLCPEDAIPKIGIFMITFDESLKFLLHTDSNTFSFVVLSIFFVFYFIAGIVTVEQCFSTGILIPQLIIGALLGRIIGQFAEHIIDDNWINPKELALLGACAQLTSVVRIQACIIVILMESADCYKDFAFFLVITSIISKYVSELITPAFYHIKLDIMQIPFLEPQPPNFGSTVKVSELMNSTVISLPQNGTVREILEYISSSKGNYPILNSKGKLLGDIASCYIYKLIYSGLYDEIQPLPQEKYESFYKILYASDCHIYFFKQIREEVLRRLTSEDLEKIIDLKPFINLSPHIIREEASLTTIYLLFKHVGVRTVYVVDINQTVVGVVTRRDITKYKTHFFLGRYHFYKMKSET